MPSFELGGATENTAAGTHATARSCATHTYSAPHTPPPPPPLVGSATRGATCACFFLNLVCRVYCPLCFSSAFRPAAKAKVGANEGRRCGVDAVQRVLEPGPPFVSSSILLSLFLAPSRPFDLASSRPSFTLTYFLNDGRDWSTVRPLPVYPCLLAWSVSSSSSTQRFSHDSRTTTKHPGLA